MSKPDSTAVMARRRRVPQTTPLLDRVGGDLMQPSLIPAGHTSVMANRATTTDDLDYFPTPPWAARAGGELIKRLDPGNWTCWEPACGGGHMAHGLRDYFSCVIATDIHDYGAGDVLDFLDPDAWVPATPGDAQRPDWIVTNPPFVLGDAFVRTAYQRARRGVAMLLRLVFLEGNKRFYLLHEDCPLTAVAPFSERVPMVKGRWDPDASSATAYAWFVWIRPRPGFQPPAQPVLIPIPPGTKSRLATADDVVKFNGQADAPLFGGKSA